MNIIKRIWHWLFKLPTPLALATAELEDAERALLVAQTNVEYATTTQLAAVNYNVARISRLRKYINALTKDAS